jgi:hypothetical protein
MFRLPSNQSHLTHATYSCAKIHLHKLFYSSNLVIDIFFWFSVMRYSLKSSIIFILLQFFSQFLFLLLALLVCFCYLNLDVQALNKSKESRGGTIKYYKTYLALLVCIRSKAHGLDSLVVDIQAECDTPVECCMGLLGAVNITTFFRLHM